jgi:exopolyphosphatase / guanosine-5'-triphosphate,3'-diphosphate pyrophosphatase
VTQVQPDGTLAKIAGAKRMVRLGAGTLRRGYLNATAWNVGLDTIGELAALHPDCRLIAVATSAIRDAANGDSFVDAVRVRYGITIEILSGDDEAALVYAGARSGPGLEVGRAAIVDIGGGSVELAVGDPGKLLEVHSLRLGVLRLAEEGGDIRARVLAQASSAFHAVRQRAPELLAFTSGTARAVASLARSLGFSGPGDRLTHAAIGAVVRELPRLSREELLRLGLEPGRADTIHPGAILMDTIVESLGFPAITISERALREGVVLRELGRTCRRRPPPRIPSLSVVP